MAHYDNDGIYTFVPQAILVDLLIPLVRSRGGFENTTPEERTMVAQWAEDAILESQVPMSVLELVLYGALPIPEREDTAGLTQVAQVVQGKLWVQVANGQVVLTPTIDFLSSRPDVLEEMRKHAECQPCKNEDCVLHPVHYQDTILPDNLEEVLRKLFN